MTVDKRLVKIIDCLVYEECGSCQNKVAKIKSLIREIGEEIIGKNERLKSGRPNKEIEQLNNQKWCRSGLRSEQREKLAKLLE